MSRKTRQPQPRRAPIWGERNPEPLRIQKARSVQCPTGKVGYVDALSAGVALGRARMKRSKWESAHAEVRTYHCPLCQSWHLTSLARGTD